MKTVFLEDIAKKIIREHGIKAFPEITVILPSRRAGLFLKKYLLKNIQKTFIAPHIITINEFVESLAGASAADSTILLFELYKVYCSVEKENPEPFENFSKWGNIMLSDFNEIDRYLINTKTFFTDLKNIQDIEDWSFNDENELSESQKKYSAFWNKLGIYYNSFSLSNKEKGIYSSGMLYRKASENINSVVSQFKENSIYIAGFNALSDSEEKIIDVLCRENKAQFIVDTDSWYVNNKNHEAGTFVRRMQKKNWFKDNPVHDHFEKSEKHITISSIPGNTLQALVTGELLSKFTPEELNDTVVVLADEQLLLPVINSLPENVDAVNITMGYSLRHSTLYGFIHTLFEYQHSIRRSESGQLKIYIPILIHLLTNSECELLLENKASLICERLISSGKTYASGDSIQKYLEDVPETISLLISPWEKPVEDGISSIIEILEILHRKYAEKNPLQQEFVFIALNSIERLKYLLEGNAFVKELRSLQKLLMTILRNENVPFFGEPLKGLQIIGMLESRALDFKNVILLSVNEDVLPKGNTMQSLIPYDLKKYYHLPTFKETDAVFAHHFYRLIQRAENIHLLFNSEGDTMGGGEKSRFVLQLEEEINENHPAITIQNSSYDFTGKEGNVNPVYKIKNSPVIIDKLKEILQSGISPSALIKFNECPLNFFYEYIIGLSENDYDENIDNAKFGEITHKILEELYKPLINKILVKEDIHELYKKLPDTTAKAYSELVSNIDLSSGKNYLSNRMILKYCERVLKNDEKLIEDNELIILETETRMKSEMNVYPFGEEMTIQLKGTSDRVDRLNKNLRIIDYKTGNVEENDINITDPKKLQTKSKGLQLLSYAIMYMKNHQIDEAESLIYSLKESNDIQLPIRLTGSNQIKLENEDILTQYLTEIVERLIDDNTVFEHNPKSKYCKYCQ